jgi:hypothetical protein
MKNKKKNIHQLTVGMRMQLCKDCKDAMRRLCEVNGETCMFHRFVEGEKIWVKNDIFGFKKDIFCRGDLVMPGSTVERTPCTLALVEFPDGTIKKVDPEAVRFLDRGEKEGTNT